MMEPQPADSQPTAPKVEPANVAANAENILANSGMEMATHARRLGPGGGD